MLCGNQIRLIAPKKIPKPLSREKKKHPSCKTIHEACPIYVKIKQAHTHKTPETETNKKKNCTNYVYMYLDSSIFCICVYVNAQKSTHMYIKLLTLIISRKGNGFGVSEKVISVFALYSLLCYKFSLSMFSCIPYLIKIKFLCILISLFGKS